MKIKNRGFRCQTLKSYHFAHRQSGIGRRELELASVNDPGADGND